MLLLSAKPGLSSQPSHSLPSRIVTGTDLTLDTMLATMFSVIESPKSTSRREAGRNPCASVSSVRVQLHQVASSFLLYALQAVRGDGRSVMV